MAPPGQPSERAARVEGALAFLRDRGAATVAHPGGDLLGHLVRTHELLTAWSAPAVVCLAGLCHALYGTDGFPLALVPPDRRDVARSLVGAEAEAIVYRYGSCDRAATYPALGGPTVTFVDRFTGAAARVSGEDLGAFALLTIANELDVARSGSDVAGPEALARLVARLAPYAAEAAALALAELRPGR